MGYIRSIYWKSNDLVRTIEVFTLPVLGFALSFASETVGHTEYDRISPQLGLAVVTPLLMALRGALP